MFTHNGHKQRSRKEISNSLASGRHNLKSRVHVCFSYIGMGSFSSAVTALTRRNDQLSVEAVQQLSQTLGVKPQPSASQPVPQKNPDEAVAQLLPGVLQIDEVLALQSRFLTLEQTLRAVYRCVCKDKQPPKVLNDHSLESSNGFLLYLMAQLTTGRDPMKRYQYILALQASEKIPISLEVNSRSQIFCAESDLAESTVGV